MSFYDEQQFIMDGNISTNAYLPYSSIASLNKKLITNEKDSIIVALNEMKTSLDSKSLSFSNDINSLIQYIGDKSIVENSNEKMQTIGNFIQGLYTIKAKIDELLIKINNIMNISYSDISVYESSGNIQNDINTIVSKGDGYTTIYKISETEKYLVVNIHGTVYKLALN